MVLFEWTLLLLFAAIILAALARRVGVPYPSLLALAGAGIAFIPDGPEISIDPELALALFVAPVLLDAAYDTAPRDLKRNIAPLISLVLVMVVLTIAAVAIVGVHYAGLPLVAAIALGAIVAPPDAVAASAVLGSLKLPRRIVQILQGESLFNDAPALLIYRFAVAAAAGGFTWATAGPAIALAGVGSVVVGYVLARVCALVITRISDAASNAVLSFVTVFGVWILAEETGLSAIITVVVFAMTLAAIVPARTSPRLRVSTYSVWETVVFVLNVLAFVIMGLQVRPIIERIAAGEQRDEALAVAGIVVVTVIVVRIAYVMAYSTFVRWKNATFGARLPEGATPPTLRGSVLIAWCGMRGLVTLATAFALPLDFPGRDVIVLCAFAVVISTLVVQGMTLKPLLHVLAFRADDAVEQEVSHGRVALMQTALDALAEDESVAAATLRKEYLAARAVAENVKAPQAATPQDQLRLVVILHQRRVLHRLRERGEIGDEAFHRLEEELDWAELAAAPAGTFQPLTTDAGPR